VEGVKIPEVAFVDESLPDSSTYILAATICDENEVESVRSPMAALLLGGQRKCIGTTRTKNDARALLKSCHTLRRMAPLPGPVGRSDVPVDHSRQS
jgi:hypothetical protein